MRIRILHLLLVTSIVALAAALYVEKLGRRSEQNEINELRAKLGLGVGNPDYFHFALCGSRFTWFPSAWRLSLENYEANQIIATCIAPNRSPIENRLRLNGVKTIFVREYADDIHYFSTDDPSSSSFSFGKEYNEFRMVGIRYGGNIGDSFMMVQLSKNPIEDHRTDQGLSIRLSDADIQQYCDENGSCCILFKIAPICTKP